MSFSLDKGEVDVMESLGPHGRLVQPVNVVSDQAGNIYVADTGLHRVVVFDSEGEFSHFIGKDILETPVGMALDKGNDSLFVVDSGHHDVKIFSLNGEHIGGFGKRGDQQGEFYHPLGIQILDDGRILIVDSLHFAVQVFDHCTNI
jgi:DNA-binding beta-propeller fold protein YncE